MFASCKQDGGENWTGKSKKKRRKKKKSKTKPKKKSNNNNQTEKQITNKNKQIHEHVGQIQFSKFSKVALSGKPK